MFNLTLSPSQSEFIAKPGSVITQSYKVTNNSSESIRLIPSVLPFLPKGNDGSVSYDETITDQPLQFSLIDPDLKINQPFTLAPNQTRFITLKITTPQSTHFLADFYNTFFLSQDSSQNQIGGSSSAATARIGSHLLLTLSDTDQIVASAKINRYSLFPKFKDILLTPVTFSAEVQNNSPTFFKTQGTLALIKNQLPVQQLPLYPQNVLSYHSRTLQCLAPEQPNQPPQAIPCTFKPPFWPGKYTVTLSFDSTLNLPPFSINFFVFPFSPLAILLPVLLLAYILFRRQK